MQINIQSLLEKYKNLKNPRDEKIKIAKILSETLGFEITDSQIEIKKETLSVNVSSYIKTEIFMKKEQILSALNSNNFSIKEIR